MTVILDESDLTTDNEDGLGLCDSWTLDNKEGPKFYFRRLDRLRTTTKIPESILVVDFNQ